MVPLVLIFYVLHIGTILSTNLKIKIREDLTACDIALKTVKAKNTKEIAATSKGSRRVYIIICEDEAVKIVLSK